MSKNVEGRRKTSITGEKRLSKKKKIWRFIAFIDEVNYNKKIAQMRKQCNGRTQEKQLRSQRGYRGPHVEEIKKQYQPAHRRM